MEESGKAARSTRAALLPDWNSLSGSSGSALLALHVSAGGGKFLGIQAAPIDFILSLAMELFLPHSLLIIQNLCDTSCPARSEFQHGKHWGQGSVPGGFCCCSQCSLSAPTFPSARQSSRLLCGAEIPIVIPKEPCSAFEHSSLFQGTEPGDSQCIDFPGIRAGSRAGSGTVALRCLHC